jgi:hypothetical protein
VSPPGDEVAFAALLARVRAGLAVDPSVRTEIKRLQRRNHSVLVDVAFQPLGKPTLDIVVKTYRPTSTSDIERMHAHMRAEFGALKALENGSTKACRLGAVKPLLCIPDALTIVTAKSAGENLQTLIKREAVLFSLRKQTRHAAALAAASGRWLRNFQRLTRTADTLNATNVIDEIDRLLRDCESQPWWSAPGLRKQIISDCNASRNRFTADDLIVTGVHGDYFAGNILAHGVDDVTVLDFEMFRYGSAWADVTYFLLQLRTLLFKRIFRPSVVSACDTAFLTGYLAGSAQRCIGAHPLFKLFSILHVVRRLAGFADKNSMSVVQRWYARRVAQRHVKFLRQTTRANSL